MLYSNLNVESTAHMLSAFGKDHNIPISGTSCGIFTKVTHGLDEGALCQTITYKGYIYYLAFWVDKINSTLHQRVTKTKFTYISLYHVSGIKDNKPLWDCDLRKYPLLAKLSAEENFYKSETDADLKDIWARLFAKICQVMEQDITQKENK